MTGNLNGSRWRICCKEEDYFLVCMRERVCEWACVNVWVYKYLWVCECLSMSVCEWVCLFVCETNLQVQDSSQAGTKDNAKELKSNKIQISKQEFLLSNNINRYL